MSKKLPAGIALMAVILVAAPNVAVGSVVCEQYPDLPQCTAPVAGGGGDAGAGDGAAGDNTAGGAPGIPEGSGPGGGSAEPGKAGELPFTGYPLSPLAAAIVALLAAGLAVRF